MSSASIDIIIIIVVVVVVFVVTCWELKQPRDDYNDNVKKTIGFMSKTTALHVHHFIDVHCTITT